MVPRSMRIAAERLSQRAHVLSNPTRVLIVFFLLEHGGAYVQEIADELEMSQSAISHQLSLLVEEGILSATKEGRNVWYTLTKKPAARRVLSTLRALRK